jgi:uncharacterized damage-inducible protein DinB
MIKRPLRGEYDPYFDRYLSLIPDGELIQLLEKGVANTRDVLKGVSEERGDHRYAEDKWTIKQVLGHMIDTERIFCARALRIARGDQTPMPGYDQELLVREGGFENRSLAGLLNEFEVVRTATISLFASISDEHSCRSGTAWDKTLSARAVGWILVGHEIHHRNVIREKYLAE